MLMSPVKSPPPFDHKQSVRKVRAIATNGEIVCLRRYRRSLGSQERQPFQTPAVSVINSNLSVKT